MKDASSNPWEEPMNFRNLRIFVVSAAALTATLAAESPLRAQEPAQEPTRETQAPAQDQPRHKADGERHGLPVETFAVTPGSKFLVRLENDLGTKGTAENARFKVRTL